MRKEGFSEEGLATVLKFDFTKRVVFHFGEYPLRVDFLTFIDIVSFDEAFPKRELLLLENKQVPILDLDNLILSKITTGRPKDITDIDEIQKANKGKTD